jgi:glycosyltransferase involved in cell wall biosynthesis
VTAKQRPKLLVLASTYPRWAGDHEPGFVHELCKRLTRDYQVTVLSPHAPGAKTRQWLDCVEVVRYRYAPQCLERLVNDGGVVTNLRRHRWMALLLPGFMLAQLAYLTWLLISLRPQAIHAHWIIPQAFAAALAKRLTGSRIPILVTSHGADLYALNGRLMAVLKAWTVRQCARATVVSDAMRDPALALGMPVTRLETAPMGVDLSRFRADPTCLREPYTLLFVGRLVEKKGLRHLIDALPLVLRQYPQTRLDIAGFGPELAQRQQQVAELGLQDNVRFLGAVEQQHLPALYQRAAMLVAPFVEATNGDKEGLGLVSVEALACGCPVVTTRIDAVKEVFAGQWPPYLARCADNQSLAAEIIRVLQAPSEAVSWAVLQADVVAKRFDWTRIAQAYAQRISAMAADAGAP